MKKAVLIIGIVLVALVSLFLSSCVFCEIFVAEPTIIETCVSPDGAYTAYVFESNGGATTGWIYHVSVLPSGTKLGKGTGNVYISDYQPEKIEWLDDSTLYIYDYRALGTTKRNKKIYDVTILFHSFELEEQFE